MEETELEYDDEVWRAISLLLSRQWFHRLRVVQEITLASSNAVLCSGMREVRWVHFRRGLECLYDKKELPTMALRGLVLSAHKLGMASDSLQALGPLIRLHRTRLCSDNRDKVYGLLGLAASLSPRLASTIVPDYSTDVTNVYKQTFLSHIRHVRR